VWALLHQDGEYPPGNDEERAGSAALTYRQAAAGAEKEGASDD
jgi:hypothetical protein